MAKERNDFLDRVLYVALRLISMAMHSFPVEANLRFAQFLGNFMYAVDKKHRQRALSNLRHSFPDMPEGQRRKLARQSMQALVMLGVEVLFTTRIIHIDSFRRYVHLGNIGQVVHLLLKRNQGMLMLTGHYGNWEILGYTLATLGFETTSIARPLDNPYVNEWLLGVRERKGQKIVDKTGATSEVTEVLQRGGAVGFIADQNAGSKGLFVDFFGRKASTFKSIALLAMEYEVPVIVGYARRRKGFFQFEIGCSDIIWPADWQSQDDPMRYITQRYTSAIEKFVREDPSQYFWVHRRWKSRPKGETPGLYD